MKIIEGSYFKTIHNSEDNLNYMQQSVIKSYPDNTYEYLNPKSEFNEGNFFMENYMKKSLLKKIKNKVVSKSKKKKNQTYEYPRRNIAAKLLDNVKYNGHADQADNVGMTICPPIKIKSEKQVFNNAGVQTGDLNDSIANLNENKVCNTSPLTRYNFQSEKKVIKNIKPSIKLSKLKKCCEIDDENLIQTERLNLNTLSGEIEEQYGLHMNVKKRIDESSNNNTSQLDKSKMFTQKNHNNNNNNNNLYKNNNHNNHYNYNSLNYSTRLNSSRNFSTIASIGIKSSDLYYGS